MDNLFSNELPALPYNGTSGHSGTDTSKDRAEFLDKTGRTRDRQAKVLELLESRHFIGVTWQEVARELGIHHGSASGALSVLHKTGHIVRLKMTRNRCKIYVLPNWVEYRETEPFKSKKHECPNCGTEF